MASSEQPEQTSDEARRRQAYAAEAQRLSRTGSFGWRIGSGELVWSEETFRILDYARTTAASMERFLERVHPDDAARVRDIVERTADAPGSVDFTTRLLMPDGSVRHVHIVGSALRDAPHGVELVGAVMDVTEQEEARAALRAASDEVQRSQDRVRMIVDAIPGHVWSATPDGRIDFISRPWLEYHGVSVDSAADDATAAVHPDDAASAGAQWAVSVATGEPYEHESRFRGVDGVYRWFFERAVALRDERGEIVKWYGTVFDIEDRKRAERLLAGAKHILEMMARGDALEPVLTALCALVEELAPGALTSILLLDAAAGRLHPGAGPSIPASYSRAIDGGAIGPCAGSCGTAAWRGEPVVVADIATDPLWVDYRDVALRHGLRGCWSTPIRSSGGRVLGTFAVYSRASGLPTSPAETVVEQVIHLASIAIERAQAAEALRNTEAELAHVTRVTTLGEVTASLAHEVNQPLAAIVNNANACLALVPSGDPALDEVRAALGDIVREGERAGAVIERVRGLATRSRSERTALGLGHVVDDVVGLARAASLARRVTIRSEVDDDLPSVLGDRVQLQQVLLNLVVNGMDAMTAVPEEARVLVVRGRAGRHAGRVAAIVSVEDRGVGLAGVQMERLFDAFYTTKPTGMGMGLAISRSIIERHGGRLWAEPNRGTGATFAFSVPAAE